MVGQRIATVARTRLLAAQADWPRFTLVRAPAGFGKTEFLAQLKRQLDEQGRTAFALTLSDRERDASGLAVLIGRALGTEAASYEDLRNAFAALGDCILLIDNADRLSAATGAGQLLEQLSDGLPELRLVLGSRGNPGISLARHKAHGDALEIGARELLFDIDEQRRVIEGWGGQRVQPGHGDLMTATIAGWPCGFGLQRQCLEGGIAGKGGAVIEGGWRIVAEYFEQEVIPLLSPELVAYLRKASVLEHISVRDCDLLLGGGRGGSMLSEAYNLGAPLWPIDAEHDRYAMLPLFREFLATGLQDGEATALSLGAADVLEEHGRFRDACVQALAAGNHGRAAQLLERQFREDFAFRDEAELLVLAERIDAPARARHPFILLALAQALIFRFEFRQARTYLDRARVLVAEIQADPEEAQVLEMLLLHREMVLALGQHELSRAQEYGDKLLRNIEQIPPMQQVMILNSLTYAQQELYIFRGAERYYVQAKKLIPALESWISSVPLETFYARHLFQTGRTAAAMELLEEVLARLVAELGPKPVLGSIAAIVLAEMKFEANELAEAEQLIADYGANVEEFGFLPMTLSARITEARLHMVRGEHERGFAVLERPLVGTGELFDKMFRSLTVERIYWLLSIGRNEAARLACGSIGLSLTRPPEPHNSAASAEEAFAIAWIQLARANKRIDEAIHLAQKWQRYTDGVGAIRSNVRWNVILASLQVLAEEPSLAMRHVRRAVLLGAGGFHRGGFLAGMDVLGDLYANLVESDLNEMERAFLQSILEVSRPGSVKAAEQAEISVPLGTFSSREAAILRLVAKGMLNREIGGALGMTEGTVKWYLQRIYDKLGIRRRSQVAMLVAQWRSRDEREAVH